MTRSCTVRLIFRRPCDMHGMRDMAGLSLGRGHGVATCSLRTTRDSTQLQNMFKYKTN